MSLLVLLARNNTITHEVTDKWQHSNAPGKGLKALCMQLLANLVK